MKINLENYEAFMLDYLEGNLDKVASEELMQFLDQHPELKADLKLFDPLTIEPNNTPRFKFKDQLKKQPADAYNLPVRDYLLIKQQEEGLTNAESETLISNYGNDAQLENDAKLYASSYLTSNKNIRYDGKSHLKRSLVIPFFRKQTLNRAASVAALLLFGSVIWFIQDHLSVNSNSALVQRQPIHQDAKPLIVEAQPEAKVVEKSLNHPPLSKDSLLKFAKDPMQIKQKKTVNKTTKTNTTRLTHQYNQFTRMASASLPAFKTVKVNAFEEGLNTMMPQYMNNNMYKQELAAIYQKIEAENENPSLNIALVEGGVKFVNWLSKDQLELQKQYDENKNLIGYHLTGEKLEITRKVK